MSLAERSAVASTPVPVPVPVNTYDPVMNDFDSNLRNRIRQDLSSLGTVLSMSGGDAVHTRRMGTVVNDILVELEHPQLRIPLLLVASWDSEAESLSYHVPSTGRTYVPVIRGYGTGVMSEHERAVVDSTFEALLKHPVTAFTREWVPAVYQEVAKRSEASRKSGGELVVSTPGGMEVPLSFALGGMGSLVATMGPLMAFAPADLIAFGLLSFPVGGVALMGATRHWAKKKQEKKDRLESNKQFEAYFEHYINDRVRNYGSNTENPGSRKLMSAGSEKANAELLKHDLDIQLEAHRKEVAVWNHDRFRTLSEAAGGPAGLSVFTDALLAVCEDRGVEFKGGLTLTAKTPVDRTVATDRFAMRTKPVYGFEGVVRDFLVGFKGVLDKEATDRWFYFDGTHLLMPVGGNEDRGRETVMIPL